LLFHGPTLQAVVRVGSVSVDGIEGTLRVLPRQAIYRDPTAPRPLTDPIVLDAFTHLLGCWGLDRLAEGDVIFPLRLGRLEVFGDDPPEGADCACRISIRSLERYRVNVDAEVVRPDGRVWMRLSDWDDWRFYWPARYRDVFRAPERVLVGEPLDLPGASSAVAVWLEPPGDMGRPVWRDVLEQIQLSPEERAGCLRPEGHDGRRTLRLWGRIAAKEAARRLWLAEGRPSVFPADLSIEPDGRGRPVLHSRLEPNRADMPAVSIAHTEGVAIAIAARDPRSRVGIDVERIVDRSESFEAIAFVPEERALIPRNDRDAWIARFWTAKEAAAKATGLALLAGPSSVRVVSINGETLALKLGPDLAAACPDLMDRTLNVRTARRGDYVWAYMMIHKEANDR
jgi:phosphopantetheinyl transferase (holo-ACP synthase)